MLLIFPDSTLATRNKASRNSTHGGLVMCNYLNSDSQQFCLINCQEKNVTLSLFSLNSLTNEFRFDDDTRGSGR